MLGDFRRSASSQIIFVSSVSPEHVLYLQTKQWKLTKLKAMWVKVSLGYCKRIYRTKKKEADTPWMKQERSVYEKMKWGKLSFAGKSGDALVFN